MARGGPTRVRINVKRTNRVGPIHDHTCTCVSRSENSNCSNHQVYNRKRRTQHYKSLTKPIIGNISLKNQTLSHGLYQKRLRKNLVRIIPRFLHAYPKQKFAFTLLSKKLIKSSLNYFRHTAWLSSSYDHRGLFKLLLSTHVAAKLLQKRQRRHLRSTTQISTLPAFPCFPS